MGIGVSVVLLAVGAILAFALDVDSSGGVDINTVGIILMIAGALTWLSVPIALFIGTIGAVSVFKAVYIDKRELKCACVGGSSNVPLGFVSLTENLLMIAMAVWMALPWLGIGGAHG